jgi:hypothetical protein
MTQRTKLIVGAVVVLGAYYLYDRSKKMKAVADLKAGAESPATEKDKLAKCTKKVEEEIATTMFKTTANFDMNVYKKEAIDRCLKAGAETPSPALGGGDRTTLEPMTSVPLATELRADSIQVAQGGNKFSSFTGKRGNSFFETIF